MATEEKTFCEKCGFTREVIESIGCRNHPCPLRDQKKDKEKDNDNFSERS